MNRRRLAITVESDSMIELDPEKYKLLLEDHPSANTIKKQQTLMEKLLDGRDGDPISRDSLAQMVGKDGGYEKYYDTAVHVFLQEYCEKHQHWWDVDASKTECDWCVSDRKVEEQRRRDEKEAEEAKA